MPEKWTGRLIGRMHNNGITSRDLAAELGFTRAYVSMILRGKRNPPNAKERLEQAVDTIMKTREASKQRKE